MKFRFTKRNAVIAAVNILSLCGFAGFSLSAVSSAEAQSWNYAAERWNREEDYTQISCFFSDESGFTADSVGTVRNMVLNTLKSVSIAPEEGQKLCPDAYSAPAGQASVRSGRDGRSEAELTAVGGDFFLIHNFRLLDGAYFSGEDIMQDGAVIDRSLAWALFGSEDVAGMNITINDVQFYVSGVIDTPSTDEEKKCSGELPRAYISYDGASLLLQNGETTEMQTAFTDVTCYEVIMPDPVENYAFAAFDDYMTMYGKNADAVQNTGRFDPMKRLRAIKNVPYSSVKDSPVVYPYWENASRITETELSFICRRAAFCLAVPLITLLWSIFLALKKIRGLHLGERLKAVPENITEKIRKYNYERKMKNEQKDK